MRSFYFISLFFTCCMFSLNAQNGLERIIVEKYYVSDQNDKAVDADGGDLPVESVTYRVFVDLLPGYIFQAAYGTPEHALKIATSTKFFNNEDRGARHPIYSRNQAENNTVMLDSWLSVGAGMRDHFGVMKSKDNGDNTIVNADGVLQNAASQSGIPVSEQDGVIPGIIEPVTVVGFFDTDLSILDDANDGPGPSLIYTNDGAWSSLNGSTGPDPDENIVLIGQFTTDGVFEFELNLQIRNQQTLGVENYVARDAVDDEILFDGLIHIDSLDLESATTNFSFLKDKVSVSPNPASEYVTLSFDESINFETQQNHYVLQSLDGRSIIKGRITGHHTEISLHQLASGMYVLFVGLEGKYVHAEKLVINR